MAEAKFRLYNPEYCHNVTGDQYRRKVDGKYPMFFDIQIEEAASVAAEIGSAADNILDGTTTPVILYVASTSAVDHDAADGAVRAIHIIGLTVVDPRAYMNGIETPRYTIEEVRLDAADGTTDVTTELYYLRVLHAYAVEWGTGGAASHDAEGNVTVADDDVPTTTYLTIDAADNESNSSGVIYVGDGFYGIWDYCRVSLADTTVATDA